MKRPAPKRWLPPGYAVTREAHRFGKLAVKLHRVADPNAVIDAVDAGEFGEDERFPYWTELWPSAFALARYISRMRPLAGVRTVELGCGLGMAGIAAALRGAEVLYTDFEKDALCFARANHELNLGRPGRVRLFDWRTAPRGLSAELVLASDVLYERRFLGPFIDTISRIVTPGGTALVAEPGRSIADNTVETLERAGFKRSLSLEEFELTGADGKTRKHGVWVHGLHKRRAETD